MNIKLIAIGKTDNKDPAKLKKAGKLGIAIISEHEFIALVSK